MGRYKIAILICAFNEEKTIKKVILEAMKLGKVFLVDDGSKDNTSKEIQKLDIKYLRNRTNIGYEKSIEKGFRVILKKILTTF